MNDWAHQAREWRVGRDKRARYLIWPMRSGKSKACIDKAVFQYEQARIEGVIVIAPNGVHLNWAENEIPKWGCGKTFAWQTPKRDDPVQVAAMAALFAAPGMKWFCVNMEALKHLDCRQACRKFIASCHKHFMMIVSEAHHFGRPGSKRTFMARSMGLHATFRQLESGTPVLNSPLRAFSQFEILKPSALGFPKYRPFQDRYADYEMGRRGTGRSYKKLKEYKNLDELRSKIAPWSSVVLREDIHDMPELIRTVRPVVMSDMQRKVYLEMAARHLAEIGNMEVSAKDGGARVQKLQQILNGYMMTATGEIVTVDPDPPIYRALLDEIEGTLPGKSLVWCRYREDIRRVANLLRSEKWGFVEYHGGITDIEKREAGRKQFNTDPKKQVCIGQPQAGGEGRDFSAADAVIFFSSIPNAIVVAQAEERATMKGGRTVAIVRICTPGTVDDRNWEIVDRNIELADTLSGHGLRDLLLATDV